MTKGGRVAGMVVVSARTMGSWFEFIWTHIYCFTQKFIPDQFPIKIHSINFSTLETQKPINTVPKNAKA